MKDQKDHTVNAKFRVILEQERKSAKVAHLISAQMKAFHDREV